MRHLNDIGLKGWLYMSDAEREIKEMVEGGLEMPPHFVAVAESWHSGQSSMLYAVASTGAVRRGSIRPYEDGKPMTDYEWMLYLLLDAAGEFGHAATLADREHPSDAETLREAEAWIAAKAEALDAVVNL